ncbi:MAG: TetR/AcrR family transcriptional regulator [Acidobacteria bacterium]|nr:TetR/AcrR family transcriptional regulator [Acidobacteriota bacterium]
MNLRTRERLLLAASRLFAEHGYRGASVRDICNHAGANPGAVSYHFGGKRQLYRAVLRRAAAGLAEMAAPPTEEDAEGSEAPGMLASIRRVFARMEEDDTASRLLLRDLADGGTVAVESLTPPLRAAFDSLATALGHGDSPRGSTEGRLLFLELAAPLFLLNAAWPVIARALELAPEEREHLLEEMVRRTLRAHGRSELL